VGHRPPGDAVRGDPVFSAGRDLPWPVVMHATPGGRGPKTEEDGRALVRERLLSSADIIPHPEEHHLVVRLHSLANPRSNAALAHLSDTLNTLELRYPGTDLKLVYEAPQVA